MDYMSIEELQKSAEKEYGISYEETLEMAYENMWDDLNHLRGLLKKSLPTPSQDTIN